MSALPNLSRLLTLEAPEKTPDGGGGVEIPWGEVGKLWAEVRSGTGRAGAGEASPVTRMDLRITCRAAPIGNAARPKAGQRFVEGTRIYAIQGVSDDGPSPQYITVFAREEETL